MSNIALPMYITAQQVPDKTAIIFKDTRISFAQLIAMIIKAAVAFRNIGIGYGEKVGLAVGNCPEFYVCYYGALSTGATVVPLNTHYTLPEMQYILGHADAGFLVCSKELSDDEFGSIKNNCPALKDIISVSNSGRADRYLKRMLQETEEDKTLMPVDVGPEDIAVMLYTSATTGVPKGVMLTHANINYNYRVAADWLEVTRDSVIFGSLPLYNTFGLNLVNNAMAIKGAAVVLLERFDPVVAMKVIEKYRITFIPAVPTMVAKIMYSERIKEFDLSSVKLIYVGGALVPDSYRERAREAFPNADLVIGYGLTEGTAVACIEPVRGEKREGSIGVPVPGLELRITDQAGNELPNGVVGEICIKGPSVAKGYYKMPDATAESFRDGWLFTGDLGYRDDDNYFYFVDRKKDMIIRGGQNIYPAEIENVISAHPKIAEVAVVGVPDEMLGEEVKAFVSLKPGQEITVDELKEFCASQLARFKVPKYVEVLDELPKGPTGKILRRALREREKTKSV